MTMSWTGRTGVVRIGICVCLVATALSAYGDGVRIAQAQAGDGTLIINPRVQVRVSPNSLVQDVPVAVTAIVTDGAGRGVIGAVVRFENAANSGIILGTGVTGVGGKAIVGPIRPGADETATGVRVSIVGQAGSRDDLIIPVRPAASSFAVLEIRIMEPTEGARPSIALGESLPLLGLIRGVGTGTITGWWEVNGMPLVPFTVNMRSGAPVRVAPKDMRDVSSRFRIGPNTVRIRTIVPSRLESRYVLVDVFRPIPDVPADMGQVTSAKLTGPDEDNPSYQHAAIGESFGVFLSLEGEGSGPVRAEWWLDGAFARDFSGRMVDGKLGPTPAPSDLLLLGEDATHYLRLRVVRPNSVDSPVFTYDVGTAANGAPASITLVAPAEGGSVTETPPTFRWSAVPAAKRYLVSVGTAVGADNAIASFWTGAAPTAEGAFVELKAPITIDWQPGQRYYWKVVAVRPSQDTPGSPVGSFTVAEPTPADGPDNP